MTAGKKTRKLTREETFLAEMRAAAEPHWGNDTEMRAAVLDVLKKFYKRVAMRHAKISRPTG